MVGVFFKDLVNVQMLTDHYRKGYVGRIGNAARHIIVTEGPQAEPGLLKRYMAQIETPCSAWAPFVTIKCLEAFLIRPP